LGCHSRRLNTLVDDLFALFQIVQLVVYGVAQLSELRDFFAEILNLGVTLFAELHNRSFL